MTTTKKVMIMAGGTGGHVFPGIAIAHALRKKGIEVVWLGTQVGMEKPWVEKAKIPFDAIDIRGLRGNGLLGWLQAPINVTRAMWQAKAIIKQQQPDLVLGMGGFVCGPGGLATKMKGLPLVIHEQNAIPGLTNRLLAHLADQVFTAFPQASLKGDKVKLVGNPVRAELEKVPPVQPHQPRHLLVLGGSRGALALNEIVPFALAQLSPDKRPQVWHQSGEKTFEQAQKAYQQAGVEAKVTPFIAEMQEAYEWADLVICRSGALTVSELMATARPAIMVPFPYAVDDHQTANAQVLVEMGGGEVIQQLELTEERLKCALETWLAEEKLQQASQAIRQQAPHHATEKIVELLEKCL
ncbi:undecaprenyldiphospho-muramoylpentapeptide beta-N-acetylglucosaminyltransferase [Galenea microaerophila]